MIRLVLEICGPGPSLLLSSPQLPAERPVLPVVAPPHPPLPVVVVDRRRGGNEPELAQEDAALLIQAPIVGLETRTDFVQ